MTHICVSEIIIIGSENCLSPGRHQAIIWTNAGLSLIGPIETYFNGSLIAIHMISFKKIHLKMWSGKRRPFCLGLNVLMGRYLNFVQRKLTFLLQTNKQGTRESLISLNTLRPGKDGSHQVWQTTLSNTNSPMKKFKCRKKSMKFVPKGPINNIPALVQIMAWCRPGDKPLSEPMIV